MSLEINEFNNRNNFEIYNYFLLNNNITLMNKFQNRQTYQLIATIYN